MTTQEGNNAVVARHLEALATAAKNYTLAELANVSVGGASYADATTVSSGLMSATDKAKLDTLTNYTLPTASTSTKGGVKIGAGLQMDGDTLNVTIQSVSSGGTVLDTVSSTVDGALWYEVTDGVPQLCFHKGVLDYLFVSDAQMRYTGTNTYLKAYLPFDTSPTADACGNTWEVYGANADTAVPLRLDRNIKKFGLSSLKIASNFGLRGGSIINLNAEKWTVDVWYYRDNSDTSFHIGLENSHTYELTGIAVLYDYIYLTNATKRRSTALSKNSFPIGEWTHVAIVKNGSNVLFFKNGQLVETYELTSDFSTSGGMELGLVGNYNGGAAHYESLRFFEGVALWTENFTPPTAADYA